MEKEAKDKYHATVTPYLDAWMVRFFLNDELIRSETSGFRWHARWVARKRLKRMRIAPEIFQ